MRCDAQGPRTSRRTDKEDKMPARHDAGRITIKKYSNRRLYDTQASCYVTLEELAARIRNGDDVRVVDARSAEDLTQATLVQIVLESRGAGRLLPTPLLVQMIRMGDGALAEFLGTWMLWALEVHGTMRRAGLGAVPNLLDPSALLGANKGSGRSRSPFGLPWAHLFGGWRAADADGADRVEPAAADDRASPPPDNDPIDEMRHELAALRARLDAHERQADQDL
jgi:polyhydroxyalkanoate synthesis repressor PhaR